MTKRPLVTSVIGLSTLTACGTLTGAGVGAAGGAAIGYGTGYGAGKGAAHRHRGGRGGRCDL